MRRPDKFHFGTNRGIAFENGRIFTVEMDGRVDALDAKTGKMLWRFYTVPGSPEQNKGNAAMEAAAKTWHGDYWKTGTGGTVWNGMTFDPEMNRIYLGVGNAGPYDPEKRSPGDGKATLAPSSPRDMKVHALDDPKIVLNEKDVLIGRGMSIACASCHGVGFRGSGAPGSDLRESGIALDFLSFRQVVKDGRMQSGMPACQWMTDDQIRQVWSYIPPFAQGFGGSQTCRTGTGGGACRTRAGQGTSHLLS